MLLMGGLFSMNGQVQTQTLTSFGNLAGTTGGSSTYFGANAGKVSTGGSNVFVGLNAGLANTSGGVNTFVGEGAGKANTTGDYNIFIGRNAGFNNIGGDGNIYIGAGAGSGNTAGIYNTHIGYQSGNYNTGSNNTSIGYYAGYNAKGSNNVYLGQTAGYGKTGDEQLYIENSITNNPLIWGDFANDLVKLNAKVGIGGVTTFPNTAGGVDVTTYKLFVNGGVLATEVRVATTWADYVFEDDYALPALNEVECFIDENGHLPNVPSAKQVAEEGISVGEMAKIQQEKIEELTLYIIAQDKQIKAQQQKLETLEKQQTELNELKALVQNLIDKK